MPQVTITLDIPTSKVPLIKDAIRYQDQVRDPANPGQTISNPLTLKQHFVDNYLMPRLRGDMLRAKRQQERATDQAEVETITGA
ncbi:hypothetical protein [Haloferula sp. A504]|uniref:hypothetical protein n=1 Tax=Haloferula sp. A504 TaxID=3373601 RepID=UPI0031C04181|nr:hypothetical protein [Verrucomicrobiaceae bacterium E54]